MPIITELTRLSLVYLGSSRLNWPMYQDPVSKKKIQHINLTNSPINILPPYTFISMHTITHAFRTITLP
jgi:hypothetical protein